MASLSGPVDSSIKVPLWAIILLDWACMNGRMEAGIRESYSMVKGITRASTTARKTSPNTQVSGSMESDMDMDCYSSVNKPHTKATSTKV